MMLLRRAGICFQPQSGPFPLRGNLPPADSFAAHNIRLDDGTETYPAARWLMSENGIFQAARRLCRSSVPKV